MSGQGGLNSDSRDHVALSPDIPASGPQITGTQNPTREDRTNVTDEKEDEDVLKEDESQEEEEEEEEEEEMTSSAHLEPSTLPWPGDRVVRPQMDYGPGAWSEKGVSEPDEMDTGIGGESQDLSEKRSQKESGRKTRAKWRESMPEGERWGDDEIEERRDDRGDGSQADDEDDGDEDEEAESHWMSEKAALGFTPQVTIRNLSSREFPKETQLLVEKDDETAPQVEANPALHYYPEWAEQDDKHYLCERGCGGKLGLVLAMVAAGILFPLLVWGGYELLPFDPPLLEGAPLRVVYTLRCCFFAVIPILLGVLVQGVARLRYGELSPLYQSPLLNREVAVHSYYVNESLALFLFYFLQLAVLATYISQDLIKLVPLLTIIFVFGRLIYWLCLSFGSSVRGLGFGLSFFPVLVMLGANFYYICSSVGQGAVFEVAPPTTAPPPRQRWWG